MSGGGLLHMIVLEIYFPELSVNSGHCVNRFLLLLTCTCLLTPCSSFYTKHVNMKIVKIIFFHIFTFLLLLVLSILVLNVFPSSYLLKESKHTLIIGVSQ